MNGKSPSPSILKMSISIQGKKRIEERINQAVADALSRGREALKRRVNVEARRYFLMVLALDPSNKAAFDAPSNRSQRDSTL